jgi:uncharacterized membrane protein YkoI
MKRTLTAAVILGLAALPASADRAIHGRGPVARTADPRVGASRITLRQAISIAQRAAPGEALVAEIVVDDGDALVEVTVFSRGRLLEVEIDGETGRVLAIDDVESVEEPRGPST